MPKLSDADRLIVATLAAAVVQAESATSVVRAVRIYDLTAEEFAKNPSRLSAR